MNVPPPIAVVRALVMATILVVPDAFATAGKPPAGREPRASSPAASER